MLSLDIPELADEFAERVHAVLDEKDPQLAERLLAMRDRLQAIDDEAPESESLSETNRRGHLFLAAAEELLGEVAYNQIFGLKRGQRVTLPPP
jgi:hypothetical protein